MMRVLLLIVQFPPDVNSTGILMEQICEGLIDRGHKVSVVTTFPHYERFRVRDEYRGKIAQCDRYKGMDVLRLYVYASGNKQNMLHRLMSYLSFSTLATISAILSRESYDVILCTNGSFFSGIASFLIGSVKRVPFVYNVQDLYPETPVRAGQLRNRQAIAILEKLERFMYRTAAHVSVITPSFRGNILTKGVPVGKVSVIPNFVDTEFIRPLPKVNSFSEHHGLTDRFVVTHAGNLGYVYDLDTLLDAAALLASEQDILLLIVGDGVARESLAAKARALGLRNVRFLPFQPRESLPLLRASSDVQVSLYKPGSSLHSMPSKVYEIMASGRPLLASADVDSDLWKMVEATGCGLCIEPRDPVKLAEAVLTLYRDPALRADMGRRGRELAEACYSRETVAAQYEALLRTVVGSSEDAGSAVGRLPTLGVSSYGDDVR